MLSALNDKIAGTLKIKANPPPTPVWKKHYGCHTISLNLPTILGTYIPEKKRAHKNKNRLPILTVFLK